MECDRTMKTIVDCHTQWKSVCVIWTINYLYYEGCSRHMKAELFQVALGRRIVEGGTKKLSNFQFSFRLKTSGIGFEFEGSKIV